MMNNLKRKKNRCSGSRFIKSYSTCLKRSPEYSKGFTLVETMFAVFILTFTIVGLMTVVANSLFAARYARDEITANYLLQEVIDYVRNDRDTTVFLGGGAGSTTPTWDTFYTKYSNCREPKGCYFDVLNGTDPKICNTDSNNDSVCPFLYYNENANETPFYVNGDGSDMNGMLKTNFQRKVVVTNPTTDEIDVIVTVYWKNGGLKKYRSLETSLLNWQQ